MLLNNTIKVILWLDYRIKMRKRFYKLIYKLFLQSKIDTILSIYKLEIISHRKLN